MNMRLVRFTKGLLDILFYVGMAITVAIPVLFHYVGMYIEKFRTYYVVQCVLYMASGVLALLLVLELRRMFATVLADDAFVMENAVSLKRMDITMANLSILKNNKAKAIRFSTLEAICKALDCQPGDILSYEKEEGEDENGR